jgi:2-polyprenyl-3-methyl-5-hydroxy-6-metoxy-1,4-benzoquinol methylase
LPRLRGRASEAFSGVPIEEVRRYWDSRPCNVLHSPAPLGSREYFDEVEARKYRVEPHIPGFAEFRRWSGKRVLEVGCGIGTDTISFARAGALVTAVDLSAESLALASRRAQVMGLADQISFVQANAEELSKHLPLEPYDLVYSFGVLHHTPHPDAAVEELRRYVAPDGMVKVMVYHRWSHKALATVLVAGGGRFWNMDAVVARHSEAQTGCPVTYTYSRRAGRRLLERHGLKVVDSFVDHVFAYRIPDYLQYRYVKKTWARLMPAPLFRAYERALGWHLCMTAVPVDREGRIGGQPVGRL